MINKMPYIVAAVFAVGTFAGTLINPSQNTPLLSGQVNHVMEKLEDVTARLVSLNTVITGLQTDISMQGRWVGSPTQTYQHEPEIENNITDHPSDPGLVVVSKESVELTDSQKRLYDDLSQRIELVPYGGFTMENLLSEMVDMPGKSRNELMAKVAELVNNGTIDPKKFTEGGY